MGQPNAVGSVQIVIAKDATNDVVLTAQEAADVGILEVSAVGTGGKVITFPTAIVGKILTVYNADAVDDVTIKVTGQAGIVVAKTKTAILRCTGTDFLRVTADV